nr:MAG TPA: hypothetical protein [Caudoviricetes sp.]
MNTSIFSFSHKISHFAFIFILKNLFCDILYRIIYLERRFLWITMY